MKCPPLRLLYSYAMFDSTARDRLAEGAQRVPVEWILDSGAFTAHSTGTPITLEQYVTFLARLAKERDIPQPVRYMTLDVIGNPEATREQYRKMLALGLHPEPIFTRGAHLAHLDEYLASADRIAFGNIGQATRLGYLKHIFTLRPEAAPKAHLLGLATKDALLWWKPASVDTSSWAGCLQFGSATILLPDGSFQSLTRSTMHQLAAKPEARARLDDALRAQGTSVAEGMAEATWDTHYMRAWHVRVTVRSWLRYCALIERACGTAIYLAVTNHNSVPILVQEHAALYPAARVHGPITPLSPERAVYTRGGAELKAARAVRRKVEHESAQ